ncbi:MAG: hypothetical protein ACLRQF_03380 [Thomasclavelia ramosa]
MSEYAILLLLLYYALSNVISKHLYHYHY